MQIRTALLTLALLVAAPSTALAAAPAVTTGAPSGLSPTAATVSGSLNPNGRVTTWYFQYGKTKSYGNRTTAQDAGSGTKRVPVSTQLTGLTGKTTYHYRLVATNSSGTTLGGDRTFKTPEAPTVSTIAASKNPVTYGGTVLITGFLVGPRGGAGKQVALEVNPFPFTAGFTQAGNAVVTAADGSYSFVTGGLVTAQLRVADQSDKNIFSPPLTLNVASKVRFHTKTTKRRGVRRFYGSVAPHASAAAVIVQRRAGKGGWRSVKVLLPHGKAGAQTDTFSHRIRVRRGRQYRVVTRGQNGYVEGISAVAKVKHA